MAWAEWRKTKHGTAEKVDKNGKVVLGSDGKPLLGSYYGRERNKKKIKVCEPVRSHLKKTLKDTLRGLENDKRDGKLEPKTDGMTFTDALQKYISTIENCGWSKSSLILYKYSLNKLVGFLSDSDIGLAEITKDRMRGFRAHLLTRHNINSVFGIMGPVKAFFSFWVDEGNLAVSPAVKIMKGYKPIRVQTRLTDDQVAFVLDCIQYVRRRQDKAHRWDELRAIAYTFLLTGFRLGDLLKFKCSWIVDKIVYVEDGKGGKHRAVPASEKLMVILEPYLNRGTELVFDGWKKSHVESYWSTLYALAKKRSPLLPPRCRVHDLRHTFAKNFLRGGGNPKKLQVIMGHASIKTTLDLYGDMDSAELGADMERVASGFLEPRLQVVG